MGRTEFLTLKRLRASLWLDSANFQRERNGALLRVHAVVCSKVLDTADIVIALGKALEEEEPKMRR